MEMCYEGTMSLPSSYVTMNEEEMTYVEGGIDKTYSGKSGWAAAAALIGAGSFLARMAGGVSAVIIKAALAGGPVAWVIAGVTTAALMGASAYLGSQLCNAGHQAMYFMATKGRFTLKNTSNPFALLSVS